MTFKDNITARYALDLKLLRRQVKELYLIKSLNYIVQKLSCSSNQNILFFQGAGV